MIIIHVLECFIAFYGKHEEKVADPEQKSKPNMNDRTQSQNSEIQIMSWSTDDDWGSFLTVYPLSPTSPGNPGAPVWPCGRGQERLKRHQVSHDLNWPQSSDIYPKYWRIQSLMRAGKIRWRGHRWDGETWVLCCRKTVFTYVHQEKCKTFIMFCFHTFSPSRPWTPSLPSSPWDPWTGNRDSIVLWTAEIYDILKINKINRCFYWKLEEKSNPTERWRWN